MKFQLCIQMEKLSGTTVRHNNFARTNNTLAIIGRCIVLVPQYVSKKCSYITCSMLHTSVAVHSKLIQLVSLGVAVSLHLLIRQHILQRTIKTKALGCKMQVEICMQNSDKNVYPQLKQNEILALVLYGKCLNNTTCIIPNPTDI